MKLSCFSSVNGCLLPLLLQNKGINFSLHWVDKKMWTIWANIVKLGNDVQTKYIVKPCSLCHSLLHNWMFYFLRYPVGKLCHQSIYVHVVLTGLLRWCGVWTLQRLFTCVALHSSLQFCIYIFSFKKTVTCTTGGDNVKFFRPFSCHEINAILLTLCFNCIHLRNEDSVCSMRWIPWRRNMFELIEVISNGMLLCETVTVLFSSFLFVA